MSKDNENMIYPFDVHEALISQEKGSSGDKAKFFFGMGLIGLILMIVVVGWFFKSVLHLNPIFAIIVVAIIFIYLIWKLFAIFIFKEGEKIDEFEGYGGDNFGKFCSLKLDEMETINYRALSMVPCFKYSNGVTMVTIGFKYGSNDEFKARNTRKAFAKLFNMLGEYKIPFHTITMDENYLNSIECERLRAVVNKDDGDDSDLGKVMLDISNRYLDICENESHLDTTYFVIQTAGINQTYAFQQMLLGFIRYLQKLNNQSTAYRNIFLAGHEEMSSLLKEYYGLQVLDLSMIKAMDLAGRDRESLESISMLRIELEDGTVLNTNKKFVEPTTETTTREL